MAKPKIDSAKIFLILFSCLVPIILVVIWTVSFIKKTQSDECNRLNYKCAPPVIDTGLAELYNPSTTTTKAPASSNPASSNPSTKTPDEQQALNDANKQQSGATTTTKKPFTNVTNPKVDAICVGKPERIKWPTPDSDYTIKTLKSAAIGIFSICIILALSIGKDRLFLGNGSGLFIKPWKHDGNQTKINWLLSLVISLGSLGVIIYSNVKENPYNSYLAFNLSLIALFALLGLSDIVSNEAFIPRPLAYIFFMILIALIAGTIYMFKFQEDNIKEGKISHAINEAIIAMTPPMMALMVLISVGVAGYHLLMDDGSTVFGITQVISILVLLACIGMYYDYSKKCRNSVRICKLRNPTDYKGVEGGITEYMCVPSTGMNITPTTITNMGIAVSVIIGLNNIVGAMALGLQK